MKPKSVVKVWTALAVFLTLATAVALAAPAALHLDILADQVQISCGRLTTCRCPSK